MKTKIKIGFRSKTQAPLFMIWKEWRNENDVVEFAKILFKIGQ